jgi:hypothetical protein
VVGGAVSGAPGEVGSRVGGGGGHRRGGGANTANVGADGNVGDLERELGRSAELTWNEVFADLANRLLA